MNLRRWFPLHQLLFVPMAMVVMSGTAPAQETITTRDGKTQEAKILSVSPAGVKIQMAAGSMSIPLANIASVKMAPPPEFAAGMTAYEAHDFQKALSNIKSVVDKYKGLPADWAQQASGMLGDIYVALNKLPEAEAAYSESQKLNPGGGSVQAEIGLARIAVSKKDLAGAKQKIAPIVAKALQEKSVPKNLAAAYSQAFYVSGQVKEASGDFTGALEDYLRTVTLFPADRLAVNAAQERADAMRKEHGVAVP